MIFTWVPGRVDLKRGEILTHVIIPAKEYQGYHGNYIKYSMRKAMDIATLSCSVVSKVNTEKIFWKMCALPLAYAAPVPFRCEKTEASAERTGNQRKTV